MKEGEKDAVTDANSLLHSSLVGNNVEEDGGDIVIPED